MGSTKASTYCGLSTKRHSILVASKKQGNSISVKNFPYSLLGPNKIPRNHMQLERINSENPLNPKALTVWP